MTNHKLTPRGNVRATTVSASRYSITELVNLRRSNKADYPRNVERPTQRGDCQGGARPCPYASCKWHLAIDVGVDGSLKRNFPHLQIWEMPQTCALDIADKGGTILEEVGACMNITRERVRQLEAVALRMIGESGEMDSHAANHDPNQQWRRQA